VAAVWGDPLLHGASFPNLLELSLGYFVMKDRDLDFVLAASPVLEFLTLLGGHLLRLRHLLLVVLLELHHLLRPEVHVGVLRGDGTTGVRR
jgi:hypothetical protein